MTHPTKAAAQSVAVQDPKSTTPISPINNYNCNSLSESNLMKLDAAYKESKESNPGGSYKSQLVFQMKQREIMGLLNAYGVDNRQQQELFNGVGLTSIDRFMNEPNNMVLTRTDPGFYDTSLIDTLYQSVTPPRSHTDSSWIKVPQGIDAPDEKTSSTESSVYIVDGKTQSDKTPSQF